ncbi:MAG: insulinase family protein [Acidobacteriota bacterium]|nr:insulinase family protein [Acidobacteriota bacterium]
MRVRSRINLIAIAAIAALLAVMPRPLAAQTASPAPPAAKQQQSAQVPAGVRLVDQMPQPGPPQPFHFPAVESQTLPNGLRVIVIRESSAPLVTISLTLPRAGSLYDPSGLAGLARTTAGLLTAGTSRRGGGQLARDLNSIGASISAFADHDDATAAITVLKSDTSSGMDLLSDVVLHPSFPDEDVNRVRERELSALRAEFADPAFVASAAFDRVVYGPSPYGVPAAGTPQSVAGITHDDILSFHNANYVPTGAVLALAGDVTPGEAFAAARKYFGAWSAPSAAAPPPPSAPVPPKGLRIFVIDQPGAAQTEIRVGAPAVARRHPDALTLFVASRIFAGGYDSLFNAAIRDANGLILNANSSLSALRFAGSFVAAASAPAGQTVPALQFVIAQMGRMSSGEFTEANLTRARRYLTGAYPMEMETPAQILTRVVTADESGLPGDFNATYLEKLNAVTLDELKPVAARHFETKNLDIVLVGKASAFNDALKKAFPAAAYVNVPAGDLNLLLPDLHREAAVIPAPTAATLAHGQTVLDASAQAAGGNALAAVRTIQVSETGHVNGPQGQITIDETLQLAYPGRIHSDISILGQKIVQVLDGEQGWMAAGQQSADLPLNQIENLRRRVLLTEGIRIYQAALEGKAKFQWFGEEQVQGHKVIALIWNTDTGPIKVYVDPLTHLIAGASYNASTSGGTRETLELWSDFRTVDGLRLPFRLAGYQAGVKFMDVTVKQIQVNVPVDPKLFVRPKSAPAAPPKP